MQKPYKVASYIVKPEQGNLHWHVLVAQDGEVYDVLRQRLDQPLQPGQIVQVPLRLTIEQFWQERLAIPEGRRSFLAQVVNHTPAGDPRWGLVELERRIKAWTIQSGVIAAVEMGIADTATEVGVSPWSAAIYPRCLNAREVQEGHLRKAFLGWPLPSKPCRDSSTTTTDDEVALWTHYQCVRREYGFRGREKLLDSPALDDLRTRLACERGVCLSAAEIYATVATLEKNPKRRRRLLRAAPSSDLLPAIHV